MTDVLKAGDWVEVKSPEEIASTLDEGGALEGLPFMPEMIEQCGRRFRVLRQLAKTCVEPTPGFYDFRLVRGTQVVLLDDLRCSGAHHDGCQRACTLLWKSEWLRRAPTEGPARGGAEMIGVETLRAHLTTRRPTGQYVCQSTQLVQATELGRIPRWTILRICAQDVWTGAVRPLRMICLIAVPLYRKVRDRLVGRPKLRGTLTRTPVGTLGLQAGDVVQIKSIDELKATLDAKGRNRGLICDIELTAHSGRIERVRGRLDRLISEPTGEMKTVEATVLLDGNLCMCARTVGGCPRLEFTYWREVWLTRVSSNPAPTKPADKI